MSHYSNGRDREYRVRDDMIDHGWSCVCRASSSKGAADLVMAHPVHGFALVQVGSRTKTLGPVARHTLCDLADMGGALALLAVVVPRQPITYWQVNRSTPRGWQRWEVVAACGSDGGRGIGAGHACLCNREAGHPLDEDRPHGCECGALWSCPDCADADPLIGCAGCGAA